MTGDVEQLEQQLKDGKELIARKNAALRLAENSDFKDLIIEGFCRDDCARWAHQASDPVLTDRQRTDAASMSQASGHLRRYLSQIVQMAVTAERELVDLENEIATARAEGDED